MQDVLGPDNIIQEFLFHFFKRILSTQQTEKQTNTQKETLHSQTQKSALLAEGSMQTSNWPDSIGDHSVTKIPLENE